MSLFARGARLVRSVAGRKKAGALVGFGGGLGAAISLQSPAAASCDSGSGVPMVSFVTARYRHCLLTLKADASGPSDVLTALLCDPRER